MESRSTIDWFIPRLPLWIWMVWLPAGRDLFTYTGTPYSYVSVPLGVRLYDPTCCPSKTNRMSTFPFGAESERGMMQ